MDIKGIIGVEESARIITTDGHIAREKCQSGIY